MSMDNGITLYTTYRGFGDGLNEIRNEVKSGTVSGFKCACLYLQANGPRYGTSGSAANTPYQERGGGLIKKVEGQWVETQKFVSITIAPGRVNTISTTQHTMDYKMTTSDGKSMQIGDTHSGSYPISLPACLISANMPFSFNTGIAISQPADYADGNFYVAAMLIPVTLKEGTTIIADTSVNTLPSRGADKVTSFLFSGSGTDELQISSANYWTVYDSLKSTQRLKVTYNKDALYSNGTRHTIAPEFQYMFDGTVVPGGVYAVVWLTRGYSSGQWVVANADSLLVTNFNGTTSAGINREFDRMFIEAEPAGCGYVYNNNSTKKWDMVMPYVYSLTEGWQPVVPYVYENGVWKTLT